jgi:hypothetical protein
LLNTTFWKKLEGITRIYEWICDIITSSESPNLKLSHSLATFCKLYELTIPLKE